MPACPAPRHCRSRSASVPSASSAAITRPRNRKWEATGGGLEQVYAAGPGSGSDLEGPAGISPLERSGKHLVEVVDEGQDLVTQVLHRGEVPPPDHLAHDDPEYNLHLVQP